MYNGTPEFASTPDQMRVALFKLAREDASVHRCMASADSKGFSGEDRYVLLAYDALTSLAEMRKSFIDRVNHELPKPIVCDSLREIYVLKRRKSSRVWDEQPRWEIVGWTEDPLEAGLWRNGATRDEHRDCELVKKGKPE